MQMSIKCLEEEIKGKTKNKKMTLQKFLKRLKKHFSLNMQEVFT